MEFARNINEEIEESLKDFIERQNELQIAINKEKCFNARVEAKALNYIIGQNDLILRLLKYHIGI